MVNSNELYDFARPTISKIVNIGGVGIKSKDAQPLKPVGVFRPESKHKRNYKCPSFELFQEFAELVEKAKGVIVMSFGSAAPMFLMPQQYVFMSRRKVGI